MPRPRHPIREHFTEVPGSDRKNGAVSCNYCGKEQSAGNPKRCQKHLDECDQYTARLASIDAGEATTFAFDNPYASQPQQNAQHHHGFSPGLADGMHPAQRQQQPQQQQQQQTPNGFPSTPQQGAQGHGHGHGHGQGIGVQGGSLTEPNIIRTLRINESLYLAMERELDEQLMQFNISGAGLHTPSGRSLLKQAFYQMHTSFPEVLNNIPEHEKTQALQSMANICNRKRRNGAPPSAGSVTPGSTTTKNRQLPGHSVMRMVASTGDAAGSLPNPQKNNPHYPSRPHTQSPNMNTATGPASAHPPPRPTLLPFHHSTLIAERSDGSNTFVVCRPADLLDSTYTNRPHNPSEPISVDDVRFEPFVELLQADEDVGFDPETDKIMYTFTGGRVKNVANEVVWRVALEEMWRKGIETFVFGIVRR